MLLTVFFDKEDGVHDEYTGWNDTILALEKMT